MYTVKDIRVLFSVKQVTSYVFSEAHFIIISGQKQVKLLKEMCAKIEISLQEFCISAGANVV